MPQQPGLDVPYSLSTKAPARLDSAARYQEFLGALVKFRRVVAEVATERKRAGLVLSEAVRATTNQEARFRAAVDEVQVASADLLTSLLRDGIPPEIRAYIASCALS